MSKKAFEKIKMGLEEILQMIKICPECKRTNKSYCLWTDCPFVDNSNKKNMLYIPASDPTWQTQNVVFMRMLFENKYSGEAAGKTNGQNNCPGKM